MDLTLLNQEAISLTPEEIKALAKFSFKGSVLAYCFKVIDGDSIKVCLKVTDSRFKFSVRILGIDTPELRSKNLQEKAFARKVKEYLAEWIQGKMVHLVLSGFDKYGRLLASVSHGGEDIAKVLVAKGYAHEYNGGTKTPWTFE